MRYIVFIYGDIPFATNYFDPENHFPEEKTYVVDIQEGKYMCNYGSEAFIWAYLPEDIF